MRVKTMETKADNQQNRAKYAVAAVLSAMVFVIMYKYALNEFRDPDLNDLQEHLLQANDLYLTTFAKIWIKKPYMLWNICVKASMKFLKMPLTEAGAFVHGGFCALNCVVTFFAIDRITEKFTENTSGVPAAAVSGMLSLVMPMYVKWFNTYQYEGQYSINAFFNPTHNAVKPFGLLSFLIAVDLILMYRGEKTIFFRSVKKQRTLYIAFGVVLFLSTFAKPTFMFMLVPAGVVYLCIDMILALRKKDGSWKKVWSFMWRVGCACIPSVIYLLFSYAAFYLWGGTFSDAKVAIYPPFTVWHVYSPSIKKSWVYGMAFAIWMVATGPKYFLKSVEGRLALIGYLTGTTEFVFLVEAGSKLECASFAWEMTSGMLLLWVVAAARLVVLTYDRSHSVWKNMIVFGGWGLLMIHLFCGTYYINPFNFII